MRRLLTPLGSTCLFALALTFASSGTAAAAEAAPRFNPLGLFSLSALHQAKAKHCEYFAQVALAANPGSTYREWYTHCQSSTLTEFPNPEPYTRPGRGPNPMDDSRWAHLTRWTS